MPDIDRNDAEARLDRFFAEDGLAERDPAFSAAVALRIARRRLRTSLTWLAGATALAAVVLWTLAPLLAPLAGDLAGVLSPALPAALFLVSLFVAVAPVLRRV